MVCNEYLNLSLTKGFWREGGTGKEIPWSEMTEGETWKLSHAGFQVTKENIFHFQWFFWWGSLAGLQFHNYSILNLAKDAQDSF